MTLWLVASNPAATIWEAVAERYGQDARPEAILLTDGHFGQVGALVELAEAWDVPIYAHRLEMPYITARSQFPPPDATVGGGLMAFMSTLYSRAPIDAADSAPAAGRRDVTRTIPVALDPYAGCLL